MKPYQIPSGSMEPTLDVGQRVLVNRFIYHFTNPGSATSSSSTRPQGRTPATECGVTIDGRQPDEVGEPCPKPTKAESSQTFIKRIVAVGGDTLSVKDGHPVVNGVEKTERALHHTPAASVSACNLPKTITIPPGYLLHDGRQPWGERRQPLLGPRPRSWIIGEAFATYWPPDRIGLL